MSDSEYEDWVDYERMREAEEVEQANRDLQQALEEELMDDPNYARFDYSALEYRIMEWMAGEQTIQGVEAGRFYPDDIPPSLHRFHLDDDTGPGREGSSYR